MRALYFMLLLTLVGCASNGKDVPKNVRAQVENFVDTASICFDGVQQEIEWHNEIIQKGDTTIYRFDVPCQLNEDYKNRIMPMEYKAVVINDSLVDVLQYWNLFNAWISEFPEPFNHRELKYWKEVDSFNMITSIQSHQKELREDEILGWTEFYGGDVKVRMKEEVLTCDSLVWAPNSGLININSDCQLVKMNDWGDTLSIISGSGMNIDVDNESYVIHNIVSVMSK